MKNEDDDDCDCKDKYEIDYYGVLELTNRACKAADIRKA